MSHQQTVASRVVVVEYAGEPDHGGRRDDRADESRRLGGATQRHRARLVQRGAGTAAGATGA